MILNNIKELKIFFKSKKITCRPFSDEVINFLDHFSKNLLSNKSLKQYPEIITFAFWIRKSNFLNQIKKYDIIFKDRMGRGLAFHIPPSNVSTGYFYSWIFGLISGNSNLIKLPSKKNIISEVLLNELFKLNKNKKFTKIFKTNKFISYPNDKTEITKLISANCDIRLIWGGDNTINFIRKFEIPVHSQDFCFYDRYSFAIIQLNKNTNIKDLANKFFNDTLIMDQNACSSPHLVIWKDTNSYKINKFWREFAKIIKEKYSLDTGNKYLKYSNVISNLNKIKFFKNLVNHEELFSRIQVSNVQSNISDIRGKFGMFIEFETSNLNILKKIVQKKYQTLTYYGVEKKTIKEFVLKNNLNGIDRIVRIGNALNMSLIWDGYDITRSLSRIIDYD